MMSIPSYNQFFSQMYSSGMPNAQTVTGNVPSTSCLHWHSGMSPHKYYLIEKPVIVANCYGCNESLRYCQPPTNVIVKHIDRRIWGKTQDGQLIYNADFPPAHYHPVRSHIIRKKPCYSGNLYTKSQVLQRVEQNYVNMIVFENSFNIVVE